MDVKGLVSEAAPEAEPLDSRERTLQSPSPSPAKPRFAAGILFQKVLNRVTFPESV